MEVYAQILLDLLLVTVMGMALVEQPAQVLNPISNMHYLQFFLCLSDFISLQQVKLKNRIVMTVALNCVCNEIENNAKKLK